MSYNRYHGSPFGVLPTLSSRRRLQSMGMQPSSIHAEEEDNTPRVCGDGVCSRECFY